MKLFTLVIALFLLGLSVSYGQSDVSKPITIKPTYFDVSPPLRDMVKNAMPVDMTWKDGVVKNKNRPKRNNAPYMEDPGFTDPIRQFYFGKLPNDTTIANFDGVGANNGVCPPDTDGDVGPNNYFSVVNLQYSIFNKSGVKLIGPYNNSGIFSGMPNNSNDGDAIVLYDEQADRWLFTQFSLPNYPNGPFYEMVAVSQTGDPTGTWYRYQFSFTDMPDYPKFGVWGDAYYMSCNRFSAGSLNYKGIGAIAMDRTKMIAGDPTAGMVMFTLSASNEAWAILPSDCDSDFPPAGTPGYFAYLNDGPDRIGIYEFHVDWTTTTNSTFTLQSQLPVTSFGGNLYNGIPQKSTSVKLDPMSGRFMARLQFMKFNDHWSMVSAGTVNVGSNHSGIRWYELRSTAGTWAIYQEGTYAPDTLYRWMPSMAMDTAGNIALGYSISSHEIFPSIRYTGRMASDPLNVMTINEGGIINGGGAQLNTWSGTPSRWGDYSNMSVDPSAPATFWYTQEYYQSSSQASWKTRVASFSFANVLSATASATPSTICTGESSQLDVTAMGGSGTYTYSWTSVPAGFTSTIQNPVVNPTVSTRYAVEVNDGSLTVSDTVDLTVNQAPSVVVNGDTTYCVWISDFPVTGTVSFGGQLLWTTSGTGTFDVDTLASVNYFPSSLDKTGGSVTLTLTAQALAPCVGSASDNVVFLFDPCVGIPAPSTDKFALQVSPNPSLGKFNVVVNGVNSQEISLNITDVQGKNVLSSTMAVTANRATTTVDLSTYPKGLYLVKVTGTQGVLTEKMMIR
jgi:hypothetical protein